MASILFVISEDWNVVSHFLPMLRAAKACGLAVTVATRVARHRAAIEAEGVAVVDTSVNLRARSLFTSAGSALRLAAIMRALKPDIVHAVTIRMCVVGGWAAMLARAPCLVLSPTGLGHLWIEGGLKNRLLRGIVQASLVTIFPRRSRTTYVFENDEDAAVLGLDPKRHRIAVVGGAGVDATQFQPTPDPAAPPVKIAVLARMTRQKGIDESIAAVRQARAAGAPVELHLFGDPDPANPSSLSAADLAALTAAHDGIVWHGPTRDVAAIWRTHHIAMLLSYREGLPRTLTEAAACGRPIITTDVIGCRRVVRDGIEGLLVPPFDTAAAARAIVRLSKDAGLRATMGANARTRFDAIFTEDIVRQQFAAVYREV